MDIVKQDEENNFQRVHRLTTKQNELLAEQKPVTGWGENILLGNDPTANGAINYHETGIIWMKGAALEGHHEKRRGEIERMIVLSYDEASQKTRLDEWLVGRLCRECGQRKKLDSHHFHRNGDGRHGFKSFCRSCCNSRDRSGYAMKRGGNVRKYRQN